MELQEEIVKIRNIINFLLEYIDIPTKPTISGETQYNTIVGGPPQKIEIEKEKEPYFKPNQEFQNQFAGTFGNNILSMREFIQKIFPNSNLKFIGAGAFGFAMSPIGNLNLPSNFTQNNFFGILQPEGAEVVLKFTTNHLEADKIKELIRTQNGIHQGIVNYYWIKEVELPENLSFSSVLGTLSNEPLSRQQKKELFLKMRSPDYWATPENQRKDFNLNPKDRKKYERQFKNFIEHMKKKGQSKRDKVYIICLDKVNKLTQKEKNNIQFCFSYLWNSNFYDKNIPVIKSIYLKDDRLKKYWLEKLREKRKNYEDIPDFVTFKETLTKLVSAIENIGPDKYKKLDLHDGNIGKKAKNEEFIFFDVYA